MTRDELVELLMKKDNLEVKFRVAPLIVADIDKVLTTTCNDDINIQTGGEKTIVLENIEIQSGKWK